LSLQEIVRQRCLVATMNDGVELVADAWLPAGEGPFPVLLQRLPYGRSVASAPVVPAPAQLARLGYAVVVQDVRGRGDSGGEWIPFVHEARDGAATVEWAAALPFADGRVATYGFSYQGLNQLLAAALRPRGLVGVAPLMCSADARSMVAEGGTLMWEATARWGGQLATAESADCARTVDLAAHPLRDAIAGGAPPWFADWVDRSDDDPYWSVLAADLGAVEVPVFTVVGWSDTFAASNARWLATTGASAVLGPWAHMPWGTTIGPLHLEDAPPNVATDALIGFFARVFGREGPVAERVRYYAVGSGWHGAPTFPPPGGMKVLYARSARGANSRFGDGALADVAPAEDLQDLLVSEPLVPYPATGAPFPDVARDEERRDVLVYTSPPLDEPLPIAGLPVVALQLSADGPTVDAIAALVVIGPAGTVRIAHGARRISGLEPGCANEVTVALGPVAWDLAPGDSLRLDVSCTASPLYAVNPQATAADATTARRGEHVVRTVRLHAASLELPIPSR
jgi:putative CocE/NonD family hydrolase